MKPFRINYSTRNEYGEIEFVLTTIHAETKQEAEKILKSRKDCHIISIKERS